MKLYSLLSLFFLTLTVSAMPNLYDIPLKTIDGEPTTLADYKGKVILLVNVASKCGYTKQYTGLEELYKEMKDQGLVILGFPCNDFLWQEPGSNEDIKAFCTMNFGVTFPMHEKLHVKGKDQHPLYAALTGPDSSFPGKVKWNFGKFLVDREGNLVGRFEPGVKPESDELRSAVMKALQRD